RTFNLSIENLVKHFRDAGVPINGPEDEVSPEQRRQLLNHLRTLRQEQVKGAAAPTEVILHRRWKDNVEVTVEKQTQGRVGTVTKTETKKIAIEVRGKRKYINRAELAKQKALEEAKKAEEA